MSLFQIVPDNFFSILAAQNKEIYLLALMALRRCYCSELSIRKTDYITALTEETPFSITKFDQRCGLLRVYGQ